MNVFIGSLYKKVTNFTLAAVIAVSSIAAAGPFLFAQSANAISTTDVSTLSELQAALADVSVSSIALTADIDTGSNELVLGRSNVTINGNDKQLTFSGDAAGWQGNYVFQVFNATNVRINSLRLSGADAGLLVNGSDVTLTGHTHVSGNEFGGIEVSDGAHPLVPATLTSTYHLYNATEVNGKPTVWTDGNTGTFTDQSNETYLATHIVAGQKQYYLNAANTGTVATNTTQTATYPTLEGAVAAANAGDVIRLDANILLTQMVFINKAITIEGNNKTITAPYSKVTNGVDNAVLTVNGSGATIKNLTVTNTSAGVKPHGIVVYEVSGVTITGVTFLNGSAGLVVNGSSVNASNITTQGNSWYGVNVDRTGAVLNISGTNTHNDLSGAPAIYVDDRSVGTVNDLDTKYTKIAVGPSVPNADYYVLDQTAPSVYFQQAPPAVAAGTIHVRPRAQGEANGSLILKQLYMDDVLINELNSDHRNFDNNIDTTTYADGSHVLKFVATDAAGNASEVSTTFIVDNTKPVIQIDGAAVKSIYNLSDTMSTHIIDANHAQTVIKRYNSDGTTFSSWEKVYNTGTYFGISWLNDGKYQIQSFDLAGNTSVAYDFTVDRTAPAAPTIDAPANGAIENGGPVQKWSHATPSDVDHYIYESYSDSALTDLVYSTTTTNTQRTIGGTQNITIYWRVFAVDAVGNISAPSAVNKLVIDNTAPVVTIDGSAATDNVITPDVTVDTDGTTLTYAWTGDFTDVEISDATALAPEFTVNADGTYVFTLTVTDEAGNSSNVDFTFTYAAPVAPVDETPVTTEPDTGTTTGTTPTAQANVNTPAITGPAAAEVLGATTENPVTANDAANTDVAGATDDKTAAVDTDVSDGTIFGLAWYWWILILAAIAGLLWWIIGAIRRRNSEA